MSMPRPHSPESRAKMRESALKRWQRPGEKERHAERMLEGQSRAERVKIANGIFHKGARQACIGFDDETFQAVRRIAVSQRKSFSEIVRTFVDWGLEAEEGER